MVSILNIDFFYRTVSRERRILLANFPDCYERLLSDNFTSDIVFDKRHDVN
jgi:hypothetical protein